MKITILLDFINNLVRKETGENEAKSSLQAAVTSVSPSRKGQQQVASQDVLPPPQVASTPPSSPSSHKRKASETDAVAPDPKKRRTSAVHEDQTDDEATVQSSDEDTRVMMDTDPSADDDVQEISQDSLFAKPNSTKKQSAKDKNPKVEKLVPFNLKTVQKKLLFKGAPKSCNILGLNLMPELLREVDQGFVSELISVLKHQTNETGSSFAPLIVNLTISNDDAQGLKEADLAKKATLQKFKATIVDGAHRLCALQKVCEQYPDNLAAQVQFH